MLVLPFFLAAFAAFLFSCVHAQVGHPWMWSWLLTAAMALLGAVRLRNASRSIAIVVLSISFVMAASEGGFAIAARLSPEPVMTGSYAEHGSYTQPDRELDYVLKRSAHVASRKTFGREVIYDVTYTTDSLGHRVTRGNSSGPTWVFMGCSVTAGDGVNDDQTLPAYFSSSLGYSQNVVNLAAPGYGAHQMLRILETGRLGGVTRPVKQVIYSAILAHVRRSAGRASWDLTGPRYVMSGDTVQYAGSLHGRQAVRLLDYLMRSDLINYFLDRLYFDTHFSAHDLEVYARTVERSAKLARERLGSGFTIIYWDEDSIDSRRVLSRLRGTGLPIMLVSSVIPRSEWSRIRIPHDSHPKPEANRRLAQALADAIH